MTLGGYEETKQGFIWPWTKVRSYVTKVILNLSSLKSAHRCSWLEANWNGINFIWAHYSPCTAKNQCRKFEKNIPRKRIARPQSQFPHSPVSVSDLYIFPLSLRLFFCRKYEDRSWEYINRSQTHECGYWGWGRAIPRKGIHKLDFRCNVLCAGC